MPVFFPGRPGGEHDEPLLDMLLERRPIPPGAPLPLHDLAHMLAAATGPAEPGDLAGEDAARAAFRRLASPPGAAPAAPRSARHRRIAWPARGRLPLAAALAVAAAGLGSATAAYVGVLPSPIQHFAHEVIGAPPPAGAPGQPLVISSSPSAAESRTSAPAPRRTLRVPAVPAGPSLRPSQWQYRSRNPRYKPPSASASCHPAPGPAQTPKKSRPAPAPSPSPEHLSPGPGSASLGAGQHPGQPLSARDQASRPPAAGRKPSPPGPTCPGPPG